MIGFKKQYYENLPEFFESKHGVLIIANHHNVEPTVRYKKNDMVVLLPEWNGSNSATFEEIIDLHNHGHVGLVTELLNKYWVWNSDGNRISNYQKIRIKDSFEESVYDVHYYRLGYILYQNEFHS